MVRLAISASRDNRRKSNNLTYKNPASRDKEDGHSLFFRLAISHVRAQVDSFSSLLTAAVPTFDQLSRPVHSWRSCRHALASESSRFYFSGGFCCQTRTQEKRRDGEIIHGRGSAASRLDEKEELIEREDGWVACLLAVAVLQTSSPQTIIAH